MVFYTFILSTFYLATVTDIKAEVQKILRYAPSKLVAEKGGHLHKNSI